MNEHHKNFKTLESDFKEAASLALKEGQTAALIRTIKTLEQLKSDLAPAYEATQQKLNETLLGKKDSETLLGKEFFEALKTGYQAYSETLKGMNKDSLALSEDEIKREVIKQWVELKKDGMIDYMSEEAARLDNRTNEQKAAGERSEMKYNLLIVPNLDLTHEDIFNTAKKFGEDQPYSIYILDEIYPNSHLYDQYQKQQLSGYNKNNPSPVKLLLVPTKYSIPSANAASQRTAFDQTKQDQISKNRKAEDIQIPSVLAAITNWYYLRAENNLINDNQLNKTCTKHIDLEDKTFPGIAAVPISYVSDDGGPDVDGSWVENVFGGVRLAVGKL